SPEPVIGWVTAAIFAAIFIMILLTNLLRVRTASPIKLLQGERQGEREPRSSWILTLLGLVTLGGAYAFALTVKSPLAALGLFFLAALMVIVGTFALFTSGSIAVLKLLKRNRRFYYRPENFISVSGMMYRMKQNAAGLASICILSTMVLITLSTTVALYAGQDDILRDRFPLDTTITWDAGSMSQEDMAKRMDATASQYTVTLKDRVTFLQQVVHVRKSGDTFRYADDIGLAALKDSADIYSLHLMLLDDYNRMENAHLSLAPDEIVIHTNGKDYGLNSVIIGKDGKLFAVKEELDSYRLHPKSENVVEAVYTLIFRDPDALDTAVLSFGDMPETAPVRGLQENLMFNLSGSDADILSFVGDLRVEVMESLDYAGIENRQLTSVDWFSTYGGFLFIGIFIGGMFLMATVMIIYYKQVSEGNQDRARFEIMQKVGMDRREVRQTIRKQILLVFFLPLAGAVTHVAFAFGILPKMLALFGLNNTPLFLLCTGLTLLVFILIYLAVFALTARTYDRLVRFGFESS
ncbi:MAG TPA: FtsX-like permease family protein, partial [Clostridia bacterium]